MHGGQITPERTNMNLEEVLGTELYAQVQAKIDAANAGKEKLDKIRFVDLSEGNYVLKDKYSQAVSEGENAKEQIKTLNATIAALKKDNKDNEEIQKTIKELQDELGKQKEANAATQRMYALKEKLSSAGVIDADYLIYKAGGIEKFNFDKDNQPVGVEDTIKPFREDASMAHVFKTEKKPPYNPKGGGEGLKDNPFSKETFNLTKQGQLYKESPEIAKQMAAEAGIII